MTDTPDIHNLDEALKQLKKKAVETSQGAYVRWSDVEKLMKGRVEVAKEKTTEAKERGKIKTVEQARAAAKRDLEVQDFFKDKGSKEPGRAVSAQPPTAAEGVKS
jgi:hypothetical protein